MLYRALKMAFWVTYDHLGTLLLLNLACMLPLFAFTGLALALPIFPALLLLAVTYFLLLPALLAAFGHVARRLVEHHEAGFRDLLHGLRHFALAGAALGAIHGAVTVLSFGGAYYYLAVLARPTPLYAYALAAVCLWCGALASILLAFALPALSQKRAGLRTAMQTALLLGLDNPLYCAAIALHLLGLAILAITPPIYLLLSIAPLAILQATAYEMLARKYATPIIDGKRTLDFDDTNDDYLNRGFRDFLFPWKV